MDVNAVSNLDVFATGKRIKALIKSEGITVNQVAEEIHVSNNAVYKWLKGSLPDLNNLYRLSQVLDTRIEEILVYKPEAASEVESDFKLRNEYVIEICRYREDKESREKRLLMYATLLNKMMKRQGESRISA